MNHDDVYYALQDKLHQAEARIRELEEALYERVPDSMREQARQFEDLARIERTKEAANVMLWCAEQVRIEACAITPPDSEPAEGDGHDDAAVDRFAAAMKAKLKWEREERGRGGWDDPNRCSVDDLARMLIEHLYKGNPGTFEDVANFAMMLHQRGASPSVLLGRLEPKSGSWVCAEDVHRLARDLDVAMNGEDGAASDPALCDVVAQAVAKLNTPPNSEPAEGEGQPARQAPGDALRQALSDPEAMQRVTERAFSRQDAMLERREALASLDRIDNTVVLDTPNGRTTLGDHKRDEVETIRQYLNRTSDKGTGCVEVEAVQWLPALFRGRARCNQQRADAESRAEVYHECAGIADRAIAQLDHGESDE